MASGFVDADDDLLTVGWVLLLLVTIVVLMENFRYHKQISGCPPSAMRTLYHRLYFFPTVVMLGSFIALTAVGASSPFHILLQVYEALVLYWLVDWLAGVIGRTDEEITRSLEKEEDKYLAIALPFFFIFYPIRHLLFSKTKLTARWVWWFEFFTLQCIIVRPVLSIVEISGHENHAVVVVKLLSFLVALKSVIAVYWGSSSVVSYLHPVRKFTILKVALGLTVVQTQMILVNVDYDGDDDFSGDEKAALLSSFLLALEAPFMTLAFQHAFPIAELADSHSFMPILDRTEKSSSSDVASAPYQV